MSDTIKETISQKAKRGRPSLFDPAVSVKILALYPEIKTGRGKLDVLYRTWAVQVLIDDERFSWLCDSAKMAAGVDGAWQPGILRELGKIGNKADLRGVALQICALRPKMHEAVVMIRGVRTGLPAGTWEGMFNTMRSALNRYLHSHSGQSWDDVVLAVRILLEQVGDDALGGARTASVASASGDEAGGSPSPGGGGLDNTG